GGERENESPGCHELLLRMASGCFEPRILLHAPPRAPSRLGGRHLRSGFVPDNRATVRFNGHGGRRGGPVHMRLDELRGALLELHKAILHAQQVLYEREHGRVESSGELLQLVVRHPDFAWIRALSALIAQLDTWAESESTARDQEIASVLAALHTLIQPDGTNAEFTTRYWALLEAVPEALVAHVRLWRLI